MSHPQLLKISRGAENKYDKFFRKAAPLSYRFWITDREERVSRIITKIKSNNNKSKVFLVFGSFHAFERVKTYKVRRMMDSSALAGILGYDYIQKKKLQETSLKLKGPVKETMKSYLSFFWKRIDLNLCN